MRAVTQPYPGAFCAVGEHKLIVWSAEVVKGNDGQAPGRVISVDPLRIACGEDSLVILSGQRNDNGLFLSGPQLANESGWSTVRCCAALNPVVRHVARGC